MELLDALEGPPCKEDESTFQQLVTVVKRDGAWRGTDAQSRDAIGRHALTLLLTRPAGSDLGAGPSRRWSDRSTIQRGSVVTEGDIHRAVFPRAGDSGRVRLTARATTPETVALPPLGLPVRVLGTGCPPAGTDCLVCLDKCLPSTGPRWNKSCACWTRYGTTNTKEGHMQAKNLNDLLTHELQDLYSAEEQILGALPDMIEGAGDPELQKALRTHQAQTEGHRARIEFVAEQLGVKLDGMTCKGMAGILKEASDLVGKQKDQAVRDAAIIASAQRVEHYEMAAYGTAAHFARALGHGDAARRLEETLEEEKAADALLSNIADSRVNERALQPS